MDPIPVDDDLLRGWALPKPSAHDDKEQRGRTMVVGGSAEIPGAVLLAGTAALRAGAGKLSVATVQRMALAMAMALPEARVIGLPETAGGGIDAAGALLLKPLAARTNALLIGPGLQDEAAAPLLVQTLLQHLPPGLPLLLDALALCAAPQVGPREGGLLITPHAGEMANLCGDSKDEVRSDSARVAQDAARRFHAVVVLKGATTHIAAPDGRLWVHDGGNPGLATSGSGDILAGLIAGLVARGAPLEQAAVWGVALHARAGEQLAARVGGLGFLARELAAEIPHLMDTGT
ncbi:NAD(P)H-hydrate dehydratase [Azohydromonas caseinilytica]|uniref:ADP-dependent (S)-NAD(P)H-hydrate dehydratase n=1 Tax=Azohydromonas caseinilytica TaxID=2728836 RepID=A0A848FJT6_9BURK|nr:NAD(P)H-hydrate dehydratase [Azohydromonas caseinilytica]NML18490.1 NAD(P)H-hydrate dehydratase [Azohydromonas caseinilytica]